MKGKLQLFLVTCVILLYITARKLRELSGEDAPYKTREEKLQSFNCFDMRRGTLSCITKTWVKYYYFSRYDIFHKSNYKENRPPLIKAFNMGPIVSSGLDYFEMLYVGLTHKEEIAVATGSFIGAYVGGFSGEKWAPNEPSSRRLRVVCGSIMGNWLGARVGLMVYDIGHGFDSLMHHYIHKGDVAAGGPAHNVTTGGSAIP
ncbi:hypothetical protein ACOSP7_000533 [Xanthoceras sorbifolium]|uniref:Uncharacterized protein n=1 Tax=Xanthoceras sorbifolium TaxID=99658 RepID=A0ABQ8GWX8_9ROSI|nr:hypothetical protein JRO89_XSUnG0221500 [Xanthoceras sorbifolium]